MYDTPKYVIKSCVTKSNDKEQLVMMSREIQGFKIRLFESQIYNQHKPELGLIQSVWKIYKIHQYFTSLKVS